MTQPDSASELAVPHLPEASFGALRDLATCDLANAIETTGVRLRNEGYTDANIRCLFPELRPMLGYALTMRVRTGDPPVEGPAYVDRIDWWPRFMALPQPRVLVVEAVPGGAASGSVLGEVHATIYRAMGCAGLVTSGGVRDLPALRKLGFPVFAGHVSVSHGYAHIVEVAEPVTLGGLTVRTGDLLHGDGHGVLSIPPQVAADLPAIVARFKKQEQGIIEYCRSAAFTVDGLKNLLDQG
ncbi:MAG: RraA family protein [Betaproteobacteria bacterium]|jgi:4-hydroxy-4-methyl-2-oxoglutarate aldolase